MDVMIAMFQQLASPEQKQVSARVAEMGGVSALRNNDEILLSLDKTANKVSSTPSTEGHRALRAKHTEAKPNADDIKSDLFEDPDAAAEKNRIVFFRKFEAQKNQILDELTHVVKRESDRIIQEVKGGPHERIIDRVSGVLPCLLQTYVYNFLFYSVDSWDLDRNGRYHAAFYPPKGLSLIASVGLARERQGSTLCARPPGLLPGEVRLGVNKRSWNMHFGDHWLSASGCVGNQIH
jgi:hypothetical protein